MWYAIHKYKLSNHGLFEKGSFMAEASNSSFINLQGCHSSSHMPSNDNQSASRTGFSRHLPHFGNSSKPAEEVASDGEVGAISAELQPDRFVLAELQRRRN
jgi:hypothetical protein